MALDPIKTTQTITQSYLDYLSTTFHLKQPELQRQLYQILSSPDRFVKGPILEATPPFENGNSIEELIQEGVLAERFRCLRSDALPLDRPLYRHQELAIRQAALDGRNLVVATGTGSGKTEAFLVPILNHLFHEEADGRLGAGVRALLLYPMNALANDQTARLRELLKNYPHIKFGRYTGETERDHDKAEKKYLQMFKRRPYPNELIARRQMWDTPPHILLTNYAMLEYLLLRPDDNVFFDGELAGHWRFLVIDEAHTYMGAKGIEMAMLLRRLKDRVVAGQPGKLQCALTSATLASGESFHEVAEFAEQLVGECVEQQDVIRAARRPMTELSHSQWRPEPGLYTKWQEIMVSAPGSQCFPSLIAEGKAAGLPEAMLQAALDAAGGDCLIFLYETLKSDERILTLRRTLAEEPRYLGEVATVVFGDVPEARQQLVALVDLAARAKPLGDSQPLIPARYHLFVRAIEGAFLALRPARQLYLERREQVVVAGRQYAVFEIAACRQCGATYLVGERQEQHGRTLLKQPGKGCYEYAGNLEFYLLLDESTSPVPDDEDEVVDYGETVEYAESDRHSLCAVCGAIDKDTLVAPLCGCGKENRVTVINVHAKDGIVHKCPACGRHSPASLVWRFLTGKDSTASVLATAFYQQIPPRKARPTETDGGEITNDDGWGPPAPRGSSSPGTEGTREGRQLLIFSDSRQDAAFFAPYLDRTYSQILRRRLILQVIEDHRESVARDQWHVQDLEMPLIQAAEQLGMFVGKSTQEQKGEVWKWILYELLRIDRRNGLEGVGCLGFSLTKPDAWYAPHPLLEWGLSEDEVWMLAEILLDTLRTKGAILFPDNVSPVDEFFYPRNREYFFRDCVSDAQSRISSWSPSTSHAMNARLDFLYRLCHHGLGMEISIEDCTQALRQMWSRWLRPHDTTSCWHHLFSAVTLPRQSTVYRLRRNYWKLRPATVDPGTKWYLCDTCYELTPFNLRGVCPTYRCDGQLHECDPAEVFKDNHYRKLYTTLAPMRLIAKEHTAQLTGAAAAELQTQFVQGDVDVLSCSTTFELGVDVGELESVFMRNVPPTAANYIQRAGRAGRRTSSTAFALTFAQRSSHDLTHFNDPKKMVAGEISPPHFKIANEKIVRRHVYATALAAFWKEHPETFDNVRAFFFKSGDSGPDLFAAFLEARPEALRTSLQRIVPSELHECLGLDRWEWTDGLFDPEDGVLARAASDAKGDVEALQEARRQLLQQNRPSDFILRRINTIHDRYLIDYLSSHNVIPKYGFPVDVVELQVAHHSDEAKSLELDRDLRIALSEYAPSSQVVAGGKLWTSRYLKTKPKKDWDRYSFAICDHCQCYQRVQAETGQRLEICKACGMPLVGRNRGTFVIPKFGFITSLDPPGQPGKHNLKGHIPRERIILVRQGKVT